MFGIIGSVIFGVIAIGAWIEEDNRKQRSRSYAKENGNKYYFDNNGVMRHVGNNKKYTSKEIHNTFNNDAKINDIKQYYNKEYWGVPDLLNGGITYHTVELFLTKEEAIKYKNIIDEKMHNIYMEDSNNIENIEMELRRDFLTVGTYTESYIDIHKKYLYETKKFHKNF